VPILKASMRLRVEFAHLDLPWESYLPVYDQMTGTGVG
jgi:hypothetical protein